MTQLRVRRTDRLLFPSMSYFALPASAFPLFLSSFPKAPVMTEAASSAARPSAGDPAPDSPRLDQAARHHGYRPHAPSCASIKQSSLCPKEILFLLLSAKEQIPLALPTPARSPACLPAPAPRPALSGLGDPGCRPQQRTGLPREPRSPLAALARGLRGAPCFQSQRVLEGRCNSITPC